MYFAVLDYYYRIYLDSTVINTVPVKKKKKNMFANVNSVYRTHQLHAWFLYP